MRHITWLLSLLFSLVAPLSLNAETITFEDGAISFEAPQGFKPLSQEIIALKYPSSSAPKYVIGNDSASTTIAYDIKPHNIPADKLDEARLAFSQMFSRIIPGLQWRENKISEISGRRWGYMEMTSTAVDTDIYNIMIFAGYKGQMLAFNFNSTKQDFPKYEQALRDSIKSIRIK
jgi:hypothetical protein